VVAYVLGTVAGGLVLGGALAIVAIPIPSTPMTSMLALAILLGCAVWDLMGRRVPSLERQVDETWLSRYRGWIYGAGYGFQLGIGFATFVKSALTYGFALAAVLSGSPSVALSSGLLFGLTRGLSILSTSKISSPTELRSFFDALTRSSTVVKRVGALAVITGAALGLVVLA
jgi:hypothetical protein